MKNKSFKSLTLEVKRCNLCKNSLPMTPRPIFQLDPEASLLIIGQAPGIKAHNTNTPWNDSSGDRLRSWLNVEAVDFYNPQKVALVPMGFCYPGKAKSGDLPPTKICAPTWHNRLFDYLHPKCTLLVGRYAQAFYMDKKKTLTELVRSQPQADESIWALPHPSGRNNIWLKKNPWFEAEILPSIRNDLQK